MNNLSDFSQYRIQQLLQQFGLYQKAEFTVVFGPLLGEARLDYAHWSISENDQQTYLESGFLTLMLHLLDILIQYRSHDEFSENYHGILKVELSRIAVEWVNADAADRILSDLKLNDENN